MCPNSKHTNDPMVPERIFLFHIFKIFRIEFTNSILEGHNLIVLKKYYVKYIFPQSTEATDSSKNRGYF